MPVPTRKFSMLFLLLAVSHHNASCACRPLQEAATGNADNADTSGARAPLSDRTEGGAAWLLTVMR
jgi:hypothetical protein